VSAAVPTAYRFPGRTGVAQHDGLALLRHVIEHGTTPVDLDLVELALHTAPLAYAGQPTPVVVSAVRAAIDALSAAKRRLTAEAKAQEAETRAKVAKLHALFDGFDDRPNAGPMAPVLPTPPTPPTPDAVHPQLDELAQQLATKTGMGLTEARTMLINRLKATKQAAPEAA
jgi:hypothetical protein